MTEKRYTYSELNNCQYSVSYTTFNEIYGEENIFHNRICEVNNKKQAQKVVDLLNEQEETIRELKKYIPRVLFVLGYSQLPKNTRLSDEEIEAISKLQDFIGEKIVDLEKKCKKN